MRLATYHDGTAARIGAVTGAQMDRLVDLTDLAPDMLAFIDGGQALLGRAHDRLIHGGIEHPLSGVRLLAPIPRPRKNIVCLGMNYAAHALESLRAKGLPEVLPQHPVFFTKAVTALNDPDGAIPYDADYSAKLDWEVELAFVIGRQGKRIALQDALGYVYGYTILNDISARDVQNRHQQFYLGKSMDGGAPMGPWIVTADEIPDPHALGLRLRVNGRTMQDATTADLIFGIPDILAVYSRAITVEPGDIFATGTPSGVGFGQQPPRFLQPGDVVEAEIDGIGVLRNRVAG